MEEYLGLLRQQHALLLTEEADADQQIGNVRDILDQSRIPEYSQTDDEDGDKDEHTLFTDKLQLPPSSDVMFSDVSSPTLSEEFGGSEDGEVVEDAESTSGIGNGGCCSDSCVNFYVEGSPIVVSIMP